MNSLLRYFYCGAMLLTIYTATHSMDGVNQSERNELNQQAQQIFMNEVPNEVRQQTEQFFESYKSTLLGKRCSENPTSGCFLLMHHAVMGKLPEPRMQRAIVADIKEIPVDNFPSLYEELYTELRKQNKPL